MPLIVTLTLTPSLDTATSTAKVYPEGKLRCQAPVFEPGGGGINVSRAIKKYDVKSLSLVIIARAWCCTSNDNLSFIQSKILCEVNH